MAWKRGYLLYGPPGTGKSTMIAAMANLLAYDVYDLELTFDLTGHRKKRREKSSRDKGEKGWKDSPRMDKEESDSKVTLSGLLNFIDGLWSACGGERIIVFTTNYVDKLDPALKLEDHPSFERIEHLMKETTIKPADVAENLMPKSPKEDAEKCLLNLIQALEEAKEKQAMNLSMPESGDQKKEAPLQEEQEAQTAPAN